MTRRGWPILFAAPHRGTFVAGVVQALAVMGLWAADLGARRGGLWPLPSWPVPPSWFHAAYTAYGVLAFFIFGFILTAGPRWQGQPDTPARVFRPAFLLLASGWLLADAGLFFPGLLAPGLFLALAGWLLATAFLWRVAAAPAPSRHHLVLVACALSAGAVGLAAFGALAAGGPIWLGPLAIAIGLWACLLPIFATVIHRMLPFFSTGIIPDILADRRDWALAVLVAGSVGHGCITVAGLPQWTWLADLPTAAAALRLTWVWQLRASFAERILAVLHVGFAWVGIAMALFALHSLLLLLGYDGLGLAPTHALTLGAFSSLLIGMATRVTLGHSGQPIVGDGFLWGCFWAMQGVAWLRIGAEFLPAGGPADPSFLAALLWLAVFAAWGWRFGPAFWRRRADGRPG